MAAFNPDLPNTGVPDNTHNSQGTGPNKTFDAIFSGLTDTFMNVNNVKDTQTQNQIYDDAQNAFDQTNKDFGLSAPDTPPGMDADLEQMSTLQAAVEQGKISQVNYFGRLATLSKQLRAKYPGYEKVVDATIQSVTGTRPANAYRDALFQAMGQMQEDASSEEKFKRQYIKENEGILSALYGDDFFTNPNAYDFDKVRADVAKWKGKATLIDSETQDLNLMAKRGEYNDKKADKTISQDFSFVVQSTLNRSLGLNQPTANQKIQEFIAKGGGTSQELGDFINNISSLEADLRAQLYARGQSAYVNSGIMTNDQVNKAIDDAMYPLTKAKEAVLGGDFKLASKYVTLNNSIEAQQLNGMMQDPTFRAGVGIAKVSQVLGDDYFRTNQSQVEQVATEVAGQAIAGRPDAVRQAIESGNQRVSRQVIDSSFNMLADPNLKGQDFSNLVDQYFGKNAIDFMSPKIVNADDLETIYLKFLNPKVTQAIVSKGTPEDLQKYTDWAISKLPSIPAFRAAAGDVNSVANADSLEIQFDPKTFRVTFFTPDGASQAQNAFYGRTANAFNKVMMVLKPIAEANGQSGEEVAQKALQALDVSLGAHGGGPSIFRRMWEALPSDLTKPVGSVVGTGPAGDKRVQEVPISESPIDFLDEQEDYDPLDEQSFDQTPELLRPVGSLVSDDARQQTRENLGLGGLITSTKRGYQPDIDNLNDAMKTNVEKLQLAWGRALPIVSGFRDAKRNARAGGARRSQHIHGNAVDIDVSNLSREDKITLIKLARRHGFGGIGVYPNSLHIDRGKVRAWGPNYHNTSLPKWAREALEGD